MAFLQGPSLKQAEMIKQDLGESSGDVERGVRDLRSMLAASPYLPSPEHFDTSVLEAFVRLCRMDLERARTKLEAYCLARVRCRDLFEYRSLIEPPLNDVCNFVDVVVLPKTTDEGYRVTIISVKPNYPESSADITSTVRAMLLTSDARLRDETLIAGDVFIYEVSHVRGGVVARIAAAVNTIRRGIQLAHSAYPQRLKKIHLVGAAPFLASSITLVLNCMNEKIRKRYQLHATTSELLEHYPARVLPMEWGGEEESIDALAKKWRRRVEDSRDHFRKLYEACNETSPPVSDVDIFGTMGAFRKLDID